MSDSNCISHQSIIPGPSVGLVFVGVCGGYLQAKSEAGGDLIRKISRGFGRE
jgi:hypothetical protein